MIDTGLEYLVGETADVLGLGRDEVKAGHLQLLGENRGQGVLISLLNIEEESTLKNSPHTFVKDGSAFYQTPPMMLNVRIVMAFDFDDYGTTLKRLSDIANYFHKKRSFSSENERESNPFPPLFKRFIMDLENMSMEQLNHIWSISGGVHYPALFYRIRLIELEQDTASEGDTIETIELESESFASPDALRKHRKEEHQNGS